MSKKTKSRAHHAPVEDEDEGGVATETPKRKSRSKAQQIHRFRNLGGPHTDYDPDSEPDPDTGLRSLKTWVKGEIVESPHPLDSMFRNHFRRLGSESAEARAQRLADEGEEDDDLGEDSAGNKIVKGTRAEDRKAPGTILDRNPADHIFDKDGGQEMVTELGENVTSDFPGAEDADLIVAESDGKYFISEADDPNTPLEEGAGLSRAEAKKFLKGLVKSTSKKK